MLPGELGVHLGKGNNLTTDIAVYSLAQIGTADVKDEYTALIPEVVIEIDTKAKHRDYVGGDYFIAKTNKLLERGTRQVIWVFSKDRRVMVATRNAPWIIVGWGAEIELFGRGFSIDGLLLGAGFDPKRLPGKI